MKEERKDGNRPPKEGNRPPKEGRTEGRNIKEGRQKRCERIWKEGKEGREGPHPPRVRVREYPCIQIYTGTFIYVYLYI